MHFGDHIVFGDIVRCPNFILRCLVLPPLDFLTLTNLILKPKLPFFDTASLSYSLEYTFQRPYGFGRHRKMSHLHSKLSNFASIGFHYPGKDTFDTNIAILGHCIAELWPILCISVTILFPAKS